eukprot:5839590-Amphidinium_carterae.1
MRVCISWQACYMSPAQDNGLTTREVCRCQRMLTRAWQISPPEISLYCEPKKRYTMSKVSCIFHLTANPGVLVNAAS